MLDHSQLQFSEGKCGRFSIALALAIIAHAILAMVGYAISRSIDARLAVAALKVAIRARHPPKGCIHHSDRGSQYASQVYRGLLTDHGLIGSMGRRGNPYDNAKAESFMNVRSIAGLHGSTARLVGAVRQMPLNVMPANR